jgi:hypothetical protein
MTTRMNAVARLRHNPWTPRAVLAVLAIGLVVALSLHGGSADARKKYDVPQSATLESKLGIRITQAAVVADGGLVELRYTVLDANKATTFQNDVHHPPVLKSSKRGNHALYRTALMKQGHSLRPGQTYYILYLNNHNAVRSGENLEIDAGGDRLTNVPVR